MAQENSCNRMLNFLKALRKNNMLWDGPIRSPEKHNILIGPTPVRG
jgi:hypothetical protein